MFVCFFFHKVAQYHIVPTPLEEIFSILPIAERDNFRHLFEHAYVLI